MLYVLYLTLCLAPDCRKYTLGTYEKESLCETRRSEIFKDMTTDKESAKMFSEFDGIKLVCEIK